MYTTADIRAATGVVSNRHRHAFLQPGTTLGHADLTTTGAMARVFLFHALNSHAEVAVRYTYKSGSASAHETHMVDYETGFSPRGVQRWRKYSKCLQHLKGLVGGTLSRITSASEGTLVYLARAISTNHINQGREERETKF